LLYIEISRKSRICNGRGLGIGISKKVKERGKEEKVKSQNLGHIERNIQKPCCIACGLKRVRSQVFFELWK
jgi:hypothetical protein